MARGHEIKIAADTRDFERGIRDGIIDPLDDGERALALLGDAASDAGRDGARGLDKMGDSADDLKKDLDKVGDAAEDAGREGAHGVDKLEDSLKDAQRQTERLGKDARDAGDDVKRGMDRAGEGVEEFKSEAASTAREAAASFDGSAESIADAFQETAANAFAGFGPAGAAAGIAMAAGVGVIVEHFTKIKEAADEARESAFQMAYDVGGALDAAGYQERIKAWTEDTEKLKQARELAASTGWDEVEVIDALASGGDKLDRLTKAYEGGNNALDATHRNLSGLREVLKATSEGYLNGTQAAQLNAKALGRYADQVGVATGETDDLGNAIYALPDKTEVVVDAKTGRAYENVDQLEGKIAGVKGKTVTVSAHTNTSAATSGLNRWIAQNNGRTFKIYGKYVSPPGSDVYP